jgi:hypothetical protein
MSPALHQSCLDQVVFRPAPPVVAETHVLIKAAQKTANYSVSCQAGGPPSENSWHADPLLRFIRAERAGPE